MPGERSGTPWRTLAGSAPAVRWMVTRVRSALAEGPAYVVDGLRRKIRRGHTYWRAWYARRRLKEVTFIGITGSAGKTTTKDLCAVMLSAFAPCERTDASENEHFNVAQTIAATRRRHRYCVVEVSAGEPGYLDFPTWLLKPQIAVLTLVARDHFQAFKSIEAIANEKGKLIDALTHDGTAVLNIDDPLVKSIGERCNRRIVWIGKEAGATLRLREARSHWPEPLTLQIEYQGRTFEVRTRLHGTQLALPVLAALGVAVAARLPLEKAIAALAEAQPPVGRMQAVTSNDGVIFLRDDWKAPYWSLQAPLEFMRTATAPRKVVVMGTLSDYSLSASKVYPKVARQALEVADLVVFVGPHALRAMKARRNPDDGSLVAFPDIRDAAGHLRAALRPGDLVLLKGSNKADHLVRLVLDRDEPIQCWRDRCGLSRFCNRCKHLRQPLDGVVSRPAASEIDARIVSLHAVAASATSATTHMVIVGLGNPGPQFLHTPHNVGQRALDALASAANGTWEAQPEGMVCTIPVAGNAVALLKPGAAMNRSGPAVQRFLSRGGIEPERCMLVHDDMDLALGDVRIKRDGGDAGHKGVRSVISALGTGTLPRVRIGVRRQGDARQAERLVLAAFSGEDETVLAPALEKAVRMVREHVAAVRAREQAGVARPAQARP